MKNYILCCVDNSNGSHYIARQSVPDDVLLSEVLEIFKQRNPQYDVKYMFNETTDLIKSIDTTEDAFIRNAMHYNLKATDLHKCFTDIAKGKLCVFEIIGFIPQNRKYKIQCYNHTLGKYYKFTPAQVYKKLYSKP